MFQPQPIIQGLTRNHSVFQNLLTGLPTEQIHFRPAPGKWCLLEMVCHLYDEEREDFRTRLRYALEMPHLSPPDIDPVGWVTSRAYMEQDYDQKVVDFLAERDASLQWLASLECPNWSSAWQHPKMGAMSAKLFLSNWLAHDYLHIRQALLIQHAWLQEFSGEELAYAGDW